MKTLAHHLPVLWVLVLGFVWASLAPVASLAEEPDHTGQRKAAFLINFAKFITWPPQAFPPDRQDFLLCVAGDDPFGSALADLEHKTVGGRPVRVIRALSLKHIPPCHLLFVSGSEAANLGHLASGAGRPPLVTVSDRAGFIAAGGDIEFVTQDNGLSFMINHSAMKAHGLQASASLLGLAAAVY